MVRTGLAAKLLDRLFDWDPDTYPRLRLPTADQTGLPCGAVRRLVSDQGGAATRRDICLMSVTARVLGPVEPEPSDPTVTMSELRRECMRLGVPDERSLVGELRKVKALDVAESAGGGKIVRLRVHYLPDMTVTLTPGSRSACHDAGERLIRNLRL